MRRQKEWVKREAPREEQAAAEVNAEPLPALPDRFDVGFAEINTKLDAMLARMDVGFAKMDAGFARMETRLNTVEARLAALEVQFHEYRDSI